MAVFDEFAKHSGLKISVEKSTIYLAGISDLHHQVIATRFPFDVGQLPVRYLGLPLVTKRLSSADCLPLIEQIKKRIGSWTARFLSFAGRLNLISSILWSICNFWLAAFRLPRDCIREIDKIASAFMWSGIELQATHAKIAWHDICKPKQEGGLGLRSLHEANDVCVLKLIWRIISQRNSLWVKWTENNLLKNCSFWSIKQSTSLGSWMWRKILKYRDVAMQFCRVEVKAGQNSSFWHDSWSPMGRLVDVVGDRGVIDLGIPRHATVAEAWSQRRRRRHRTPNLNLIEENLHAKWQTRSTEEYVVLWKGRNNAYKPSFSTKDTWNHTRNASHTVARYKGVWFTHATPKCSFCSWLAVWNRLSTGDRMLQRNRGVDATCVLCNADIESRDHLFFTCRYSAEIWAKLAKNIFKSRFTTNWQAIVDCISASWQDRTHWFIARYLFQAAIHTIWRERNGRRHGDTPNQPIWLIQWIDRQIRNQFAAIKISGDGRYTNGLQAWFASRV